MSKNLVIVESPAKAKTIEKYLGKDYKVKSSFGHIRDLPSKGMSIDIENNFEPDYKVTPDKTKVVAELRKAAKEADMIWLASDEDREGEAIAWHLVEALKLPKEKTKRIVFHEITKTAITKAIEHPRAVHQHLVDAQQARRILDRLVGYELSPVLWKKVRPGLSAGRVQSVAVRIIVEREREIEKFESASTYRVVVEVSATNGPVFTAELVSKLADKQAAHAYLAQLTDAELSVANVEQKPGKRSPGPPFTTSTLQQFASRAMGSSVKQTMMLAQRLYEAGHITYMRTDSLNLAEDAIAAAAQQIEANYGTEYVQSRRFKTKNQDAQEAHEAIRPTNFATLDAGADPQQKKLYKLIWQRAVSSQMADAKIEKTVISIKNSANDAPLEAKGEVIVFDGFLKLQDKLAESQKLPDVQAGDSLTLESAGATEVFSKPPARYTEASLVKKLEEMGIGRPSTYAPTISTIQDRGYVEKGQGEGTERTLHNLTLENGSVTEEDVVEKTGSDKGKLLPTGIAGVVTDFLVKHFSHVVDYDFTREVEVKFDNIAKGQQAWRDMIADFYGPFHKKVDGAADISREEVSQARELGVDPKSKRIIYARHGRFGPMVQMGEAGKEVDDSVAKPKFAPMPVGKKVDTVTLEEALEMFKLPRKVGTTTEGVDIEANLGRFGPYVKYDGKFVSIKPEDPFTITEEQAREFIAAHIEKEKNKYIKRFEADGIDVLNGRYGPYITDGNKNAKIPKDKEPKDLTLEEVKQLIAEAPERGKGRFGKKKPAPKKKAPAKKKTAAKKN